MGRANTLDEPQQTNNLNSLSNQAIQTHLNNISSNVSSEAQLTEIVNKLIELGYDGFLTDTNGNTPLYHSVMNGYSETVNNLIKHHGDIDINDTVFSAPLLIEQDVGNSVFDESKYANSNLIKIVNHIRDGKSLLYIAVDRESYDIACSLILAGSEISSLNEDQQKKLLLYACNITHGAYYRDHDLRPVVGLLLLKVPEAVSSFSENYQYPRLLSYYLLKGHLKVIDAILSPISDPAKRKRILDHGDNHVTPLDRVSPVSHSEDFSDDVHLKMVKYLLDNGASNTANNFDPICRTLQSSALKGHLETFKYLLEKADKNDFNTYIGLATIHDRMNIVKYLWENYRHYTVSSAGSTALHYAADRGGLQSVKYLVENGADVNQTNGSRQTPLHFALEERRREVIGYLICQDAHCHCCGMTCKYPIVT